jgi:hypothetical protein
MQGEFLIELAVDIKPPKDWHKVCSTKKVHRWRPPEVASAVAEREQASERLQVRPLSDFRSLCSQQGQTGMQHLQNVTDDASQHAACSSKGTCVRGSLECG